MLKTRYNYYTTEKDAQLLIHTVEKELKEVKIEFGGETLASEKKTGVSPFLISFPIENLPIGSYDLLCSLLFCKKMFRFKN
jgi:hypothetical protein